MVGAVRPVRPANRCICYCRDCRAFANHLGRSAMVFDADGGTQIVQVPPAHLEILSGAEQLACLLLTDKGLLRWYARCCNTPIGNTANSWSLSFVGLIRACLGSDDAELEASFGRITMRVHSRSAARSGLSDHGVAKGVARVMLFAARARLDGSYKTTPFFRHESGLPVAEPVVLTPEQLRAARGNESP